MNLTSYFRLVAIGLAFDLSSCSYIKSLFPDKGRDYQYTTEIPPLVLPSKLKKDSAFSSSEDSSTELTVDKNSDQPVAQSDQSIAQNPEDTTNTNNTDTETQAPAIEPIEKNESITVELVKYNDGENRLRIDVEKPRAWRLVSKALSRKSIEVTERNQDEGFFIVQFDANEQQVEDGSLWDEALFIFRGFQSNEKVYRLVLEEINNTTNVIIQDKDQQPLAEDAENGLKLLTLIQEAINADLVTK